METALANPVMEVQEPRAVSAHERSLQVFVLKLVAMAAWLGIGGFLAWLVHDFGVSSGFGQDYLAAWLVFSLFGISGFLISMLSWNSYRVAMGKPSWLSQPV